MIGGSDRKKTASGLIPGPLVIMVYSGRSEFEGYVVNVEVEAFGAYVRFAAAGAYHYYGVGGSGVGAVITFFYYGAELAFGVAGVVSVAVAA